MDEIKASALRDGVAYADRWLAYRREFRDHPGLVAAVQHADDLLLLNAYGYAQLEDGVPMTTDHIFRIASHSKTFTATAIMQLVEQGQLRLDDRASASLPWLSVGPAGDVTIRQLLNHASGLIRDGSDADFWQVQAEFPDRDRLRSIAANGAILGANTTFKYSNIGFAVLGLVIEAVTGASYNDFVRAHIVQPLGLQDTGPEVEAGMRDRLVTGYTRARFGVSRQAMPLVIDTHAMSPATGFYSTAHDLCRYASAHWMGDARLLTDASKREMQQPYWYVEHADEHYGLGFSVCDIGKRRLIGHGGGFPGQSTRTLIDTHDRLVVVVLSNTNASDGLAAPLAESVVKIIDYALERAGTRSDAADRYTGRYVSLGGVVDVVAFGSSLIATSPEADDPVARVTELSIVDDDTLRVEKGGGYGAPGEPVRFERDEQGKPMRVVTGGVSAYPVERYRKRYAVPVLT